MQTASSPFKASQSQTFASFYSPQWQPNEPSFQSQMHKYHS